MKRVFIRVKDGPQGERRYDEIEKYNNICEARKVKDALEKAGHSVIIQESAIPPCSEGWKNQWH